jgi:uncharacterized integral membrane protein
MSASIADNANSEQIKPLNQDDTYNETLTSLQNRMSPASKAFSKLIHNPAVERTSAILESTIMRPSVVMGTTWTALIVGVIFYVTARVYGFKLSGSEMLLALLGGAVLGLVLEGIWMFFTRKQRDQ